MSGRVRFGGCGIFVLVFFFHNSLYLDCRDHLFFGTTGDELFGALGNLGVSYTGWFASRDSFDLYLGCIYPFLLHGDPVSEPRISVVE